MQPADAERAIEVSQRARHAHDAVVAARAQLQLLCGGVQQVAAFLVGAGDLFQQRAVGLGVAGDAVAFVTLGLDGAGTGNALRNLARAFRRRRQRQVGCGDRRHVDMLVNAFTVLNWEEDKTIPATRYLPRIISFLGYDPLPAPRTLEERLVAAGHQLGIPRKKLARDLRLDEATLKRWEEDRAMPRGNCRTKVFRFLDRTGRA